MHPDSIGGLFSLAGKCFIVTGGNGGLGLGMARGLAKCGADIVIAARDAAKGAIAAREIEGFGVRAAFVETDVANGASCLAMAAATMDLFGRIDGLIANAGVVMGGEPQSIPDHVWRTVLSINLDGVLFSCRAVHPHLKAAGGGKIIVTGSMFSVFGCPNAIEYGASKGAAVQLAKGMAIAWAPDNIQVNAILPGYLMTDIIAESKGGEDDAFDRSLLARTPAGRWGKPEDLEGIAAFLCSPASGFVTGTAIPVDGGYSVKGDTPAKVGG